MATYDKKTIFLKAFFKVDSLGINKTKLKTPKRDKTFKKDDNEVDSLLKAFERLTDGMTLVDPREYYGALQTVSKGILEWLSWNVKDMEINGSKTINMPVKGAKVKIRKLAGDLYSGWIIDKKGDIEHLYDRLTLPALASQIMAVYEIYTPEKDEKFESPQTLRSLREEIAEINSELKGLKNKKDKDLVATRLKGLIESLSNLSNMIDSHKKEADEKHDSHQQEFSGIHQKLEELKAKLPTPPPSAADEPQMEDKIPVKQIGEPVHCDDCGCCPCKCFIHLPRPTIEVEPSGKVSIFFKSEFSNLDKMNWLRAMRFVIDQKKR